MNGGLGLDRNFDIGVSKITSKELYCTELTDEVYNQILEEKEIESFDKAAKDTEKSEEEVQQSICDIIVKTKTTKEFNDEREKVLPSGLFIKKHKDRKKRTAYSAASLLKKITLGGGDISAELRKAKEISNELVIELMKINPEIIKKCMQKGERFEKKSVKY